MFCKFCSAQIDPDAAYCYACGRKLLQQDKAIDKPEIVQEVPIDFHVSDKSTVNYIDAVDSESTYSKTTTNIKFCHSCGEPLDYSNKFCSKCGCNITLSALQKNKKEMFIEFVQKNKALSSAGDGVMWYFLSLFFVFAHLMLTLFGKVIEVDGKTRYNRCDWLHEGKLTIRELIVPVDGEFADVFIVVFAFYILITLLLLISLLRLISPLFSNKSLSRRCGFLPKLAELFLVFLFIALFFWTFSWCEGEVMYEMCFLTTSGVLYLIFAFASLFSLSKLSRSVKRKMKSSCPKRNGIKI